MTLSIRFASLSALIAASCCLAQTLTVPLLPSADRKAAADFALRDSNAKIVKLSDYRGKVVVLDFWATWCAGCKEELPIFSELQHKYGSRGLTVIGVSVDDEGWKVVKPFLKSFPESYTMVVGDTAMSRNYGIANMPNTFVIDHQGRIAAAYRAGLVNKDDIEVHIRQLLGGE